MPSIVKVLAAAGMAAAATLSLSAGALSGAAALVTDDPVDLGGDVFVDETGTLSGQASQITQSLEETNGQSDADTYAIVVDSFDGAPAEDWANEAAALSGLDQSSALIVVALDDGQYGFSIANSIPRDQAQLNDAEQNFLVPALNNGDISGAITGYADRLAEDAAAPGEVTPAMIGTGAAVVGGVAVVGGGIFVGTRVMRRRKTKQVEQAKVQEHQLSLEQLKQRADVALVRLDDTVQQSDQELQFAVAQFGAQPVAQYQQAVERAKGGLTEAFQLQQQLDDAYPDSDQERHDWSSRILQIAEGATAELASHAKGFEELRDLETTAPQALDAAAKVRAELEGRIANARGILDRLDDRYTGSSIAPVQSNIDGAERLLPAIDEAIAEGRAAGGGQAAVAVHAAEAAIAQASSLLAGVERAGDDLARSEEQLRALVDDTVNDVAIAKTLPKGASDLAPVIQLAEQAIAEARRQPVDVAEALPRLQRANETLDRATGQARDAGDRGARAASGLERWIQSARQNIDSAEQFLSTRRMGVGSEARRWLSLAQEDLAQALRLQGSDLDAARAAAERASQRADQALRAAQDDVSHYGDDDGSRNPYYRGRGRRDRDDDDDRRGGGLDMGGMGSMVMGGVLGSVLGNILTGGGHGHGGGDWGASAGGDGGGGFFGGGGDGGGFTSGGGDFGGFFGGGGDFGGFDGGGGGFGD